MTPEQFSDKLDQFAAGLPKAIGEAVFVAANEAKGIISQRVFNRGEAADGSLIGEYSTKPMLVGAKSFLNKTAAKSVLGTKKKRSELEWRRVNGHNLAVLEGGYKAVRNISKLRIDTVDLGFHGNLKKAIETTEVRKEKGGYSVIIKGDKEVAKARANEERFKKAERTIFAAGQSEQEEINKVYEREIANYFNRFF